MANNVSLSGAQFRKVTFVLKTVTNVKWSIWVNHDEKYFYDD